MVLITPLCLQVIVLLDGVRIKRFEFTNSVFKTLYVTLLLCYGRPACPITAQLSLLL